MRKTFRVLAVLALFAALVPMAAAPAMADMYREFTGVIKSISHSDNGKLIVDNRMGDKVSFRRIKTTEVSGQGKKSWDDLERGDWVTVSWKFMDKPRKAYKVEVKPAPKEQGENQ